MDLKMRVNTKRNVERGLVELEEELEPVSPTSEYLLNEVATLYILIFFELEVPVNLSSTIAFFKDVFAQGHPRFTSIPVENKKGKKMWKKVTINVEDHIKVPSFLQGLSAENYSEHFDNYIFKIATSQLPLHKPLWELHVINNYPEGHSSAGMFILKIHHAIGDGTSLMRFFFSIFTRVDDPSLPFTFHSKTTQSAGKMDHSVTNTMINKLMIVPKFISSIMYSLYDFGQGVRLALFEDTKTPIKSGTTDMTRPFSSRVCSLNFSLSDVKRIKTLLGVTVNDIIIGIIFYGTRLYIQETNKGSLKNTRATAAILVDMRRVKQTLSSEEMYKDMPWGNRFSLMALPLPNFEDENFNDPLKFILEAHKIVKAKRSAAYGPFLMGRMLGAIKTFAGVQTTAQSLERIWKNSSFCITNVIGPREQFSIANHPVNSFYFAPTGANLSLVVSAMSYMENLRLGLVVENGFIDHQRLITCLKNAYQLILEAAQATSNHTTQ